MASTWGELSGGEQAESELLASAALSSTYTGILKTAGPWPRTTTELHHKLVQQGGTSKQGCFSTENITCASHFASTYRGITSGRSGQRLDYRKPDRWVKARDAWRRDNLLSRAGGDYAVINVASRLFPHDPDDITLACEQIDTKMQACLLEILAHLRNRGLKLFFRGFPARLNDNITQIQALCHQIGIVNIQLISTGTKLRHDQRQTLEHAIGNGQLITEYGAQDCGVQLYSCPECGAFHLENPRSLLSVEQNRLYATDRFSVSQPVVAMDTGDQMLAAEGRCQRTGQRGYRPNPMPGFSPAISQLHPRAAHGSANLQHPAARILLTPQAQPAIREAIEAAGFSTRITPIRSTQDREALIQLIVQQAEQGTIQRCRLLLETGISRCVLGLFQQKQVSLISHLISHLMIWTPQTWAALIQPWIHCAHTPDRGELKQLLQLPLQQISETSSASSQALLRLHRRVGEALICILQTDPPASELMRCNHLQAELQPILHAFQSADPRTQQTMLPSISGIKDHILAYLWHADPAGCSLLHQSLQGCDDSGIEDIERLHRAGLLRKF